MKVMIVGAFKIVGYFWEQGMDFESYTQYIRFQFYVRHAMSLDEIRLSAAGVWIVDGNAFS